MNITVGSIAALVGGVVEGDASATISRPAGIEQGAPGTISFLADHRYEEHAYTSQATALIVGSDFKPRQPLIPALIRVPDVRVAVAMLLDKFQGAVKPQAGISSQAMVADDTRLGEGVSVGHFAVISNGASIGKNTVVYDQVYVGPHVRIGEDCVLFPGTRIYHDCELGDRCIVHSNTVIGADGFGFAPREDGSYAKVAQVGRVRIGNDVEIGSACTIDRATMGETVIEDGVKLDNLIQIAHNVHIGAHTVIAAQAGIAGSTRIGRHCQIGGQVGFAGHLEIADGSRFQAQSGVATSISEPGQAFFGSPAIPYHQYLRAYTVFKNLPDLDKRLRKLERIISALDQSE